MPVRSILQIDVQDAAFQRFQAAWNNYQKALKSQPAFWAAINQHVNATRQSFDEMVVAMAAANVQSKLREKAQERADQLTRTAAEKWKMMARDTREFASNIGAATVSLLKWASLTGIISGLVGAGGLWGIDRLAMGVAGSRRSALGLGVGIGEQSAFGANLARLVDPQAFLESVAGAKFDVTKRVGLLGAGLSQGEIEGGTAQTAVALLRNLKRLADTTDPRLFAQILQARRLDQFAAPTDLERLRNTSPAEFERILQQYSGRARQFEPGADVAEKWQDFVTQMSNAGQSIENTFVKGLVPLAPGLTKLSESVSKVIESFLSSPTLSRWIGDVDQALERFAGYIGTAEFQEDVRRFVEGMAEIADTIVSWVKWAAPTTKTIVGAAQGTGTLAGVAKDVFTPSQWSWEGLMGRGPGTPEALLGLVRKLEGSGDREVSRAGAVGRYQIMPGTALQYGGDPGRLAEPAYNEELAKKILADLIRRYHGNTAEILAAYNAGPGAGDRFRRAGDNPAVLPRETQQYVTRARGLEGYAPATVTIENNTGGNATVSINGLKN